MRKRKDEDILTKDQDTKIKEKSGTGNTTNRPRTRVGILKLGNIASSILLEMLLDERADRLDVEVRTVSSGAKLEAEPVTQASETLLALETELIIVCSPNASLADPLKAIRTLNQHGKPVIVITDTMKKETMEEFVKEKIGYLIVKADAMIGARREFLDPIEMALFNSDVIRVLAVGGVFNILYQQIDKVVHQIANKEKIILPQLEITSKRAVTEAGFANPYAEAKARAALEIAERVSLINSRGCFKIKGRLNYVLVVATGHEMMRSAAKMADEAREIEKTSNKVRRRPHSYEGEIQDKRLLTEKPR